MVVMSGSVFSEQILADKLSKLNSTQQCIETLSHWCIFHRSKAELVVTTWDKQFHDSDMAQKVPLLYLANDILQNSKRKGNEFVDEFWKVLPGALKDVLEKDDERGKNVVSRLVGIWEERRVFGSRSKSLKDLMLGGEAPPPLDLSKKRSRSVRIMKRDSRSIKTVKEFTPNYHVLLGGLWPVEDVIGFNIMLTGRFLREFQKLTIGSSVEKIVSAFHVVLGEQPNEDVEMNNCKSAVHRVRKIEKDVDIACLNPKDPKREKLSKELEGEETTLKQCVEKLNTVEESRALLVSQLREALHEQESQLENVRTQMQVAHAQAQEVEIMRKRLTDENYIHKPSTSGSHDNGTSLHESRTPRKTAASIAAEVVDKLAASTSSQLIMTSVLSSFAAEEAKNAGFTKSSPATEKPMMLAPSPATNHSFSHGLIPPQAVPSQIPTSQPLYQILPNPPTQPYIQPAGPAVSSYGFVNFPASHGLPPPPQMASPLVTAPPGFQQMVPNQTLTLAQPAVPVAPQPPFRPLQPPQMMYYAHQHQPQ